MTTHCKAILLVSTACASALICAAPVRAQEGRGLEEVIVTARKRQESILNVPVVETAIAQKQLQRFHTQDLKDIATLVPGMALGDSILSIGTQISIRGVGTTTFNPAVDQSVSLNIDGLQLSQGLAYSSGMFDMGQVEVLEGPQALFYGKSSPGGVISIRSADPTNRFELIGQAGYEFEAEEKQGEIIISGPVTDTLKLRLAAQYDDQAGFYDNVATGIPALGGRTPTSNKASPSNGYKIRGTALWNPISQFDARLKINEVHDRVTDSGAEQFVRCPDGTGPLVLAPGFAIPFLSPKEDCKPDRQLAMVDMVPAAFPGIPNGGTNYIDTTQTYGTLELNYRPTRDLTLTSTTGYYLLHSSSLFNPSVTGAAGPILAVPNSFRRREVTEEIRANSDFAGPVNFTLGGFLQRADLSDLVTLIGNQALGFLPALAQKGVQTIDINTDSVFGQVRYKIIPQVEIAAGARWTDEKRVDTPYDFTTGTPILLHLKTPSIHSSNVSPEVTVTYKPTGDLTFFGALKRGYKSGSFDTATPPTPNEDNAFGDEKVEGGELGMKSRWLDRRLLFNVAAYDYRYTGLQVGAIIPVVGGIPVTKTINAGGALVAGIESDIAYRPPQIEGLGLHASVNWNHAQFKTLDHVSCYGGQTFAAGCNETVNYGLPPGSPLFNPNPPGSALNPGLNTNESRLPLVRAPKWQTNFGFDYETPVGNGLTLVLGSTTQYSSKYLTGLGLVHYQTSFFKTDMNITLQGPKDRWEISLIGKNLNDALTSGNCTGSNAQGGLIGEITGTSAVGPAGTDETGCWMDRGREVWVRLTLRPFN